MRRRCSATGFNAHGAGSHIAAGAMSSIGCWVSLLAAIPLVCTNSALADAIKGRSPDLRSEFAELPYANLLLETRTVSIPFPDTRRAEVQKIIKFVVVGNIPVRVHAEPDSRIKIGGRSLGKAMRGSEVVGYDVAVRLGLKRRSMLSSMIEPRTTAASFSGNSTTTYEFEPPADEDEKTNWMWHRISGELAVKTNSAWSANGGLPLAGDYVGQVTITLTPDF